MYYERETVRCGREEAILGGSMGYGPMDEGNTVENILGAIERMDAKTLKDTLAYLLKVYVIDRGLGYEGYVTDDTVREQEAPRTFAELVMSLKERFPMEELRLFQVEGQNVFITIDGKRTRISGAKQSGTDTRPDQPVPNVQVQNKNRPTDTKSNGRFGKLELD